jgi:hypothetical protein
MMRSGATTREGRSVIEYLVLAAAFGFNLRSKVISERMVRLGTCRELNPVQRLVVRRHTFTGWGLHLAILGSIALVVAFLDSFGLAWGLGTSLLVLGAMGLDCIRNEWIARPGA